MSEIIIKNNTDTDTIESIKNDYDTGNNYDTENDDDTGNNYDTENNDDISKSEETFNDILLNTKDFKDEKWRMLRIIGGSNFIPLSLKC